VNASNKISIIIVTYNSLPALRICLSHLKPAVRRIDCELIIVDNNSSDHSPSVAKNLWPDTKVIMNRINAGFAAACNIGAKEAHGTFLMFINPDVFVDIHAVESLLEFMDKKEKIGAVGGRMRFPDGTFQPTCRNLPTLQNMIFSRGSFLWRILRSSHAYTWPDFAAPTEVPAVAGTLLMIRKDVFEKVGRFDSGYFMFMEDTDICKRLSMLGFTNLFLPTAGAVHEWGKGSSVGSLKRNWHHHRSVQKYFMKHRRGWSTYIVLPIMLFVNFVVTSFFATLKFSKI